MMRLLVAPLLALSVAGQASDIYVQPRTTVLGCTCEQGSACETSLTARCNANSWCYVTDKSCAKGSSWDYCKFGPYKTYEEHTAKEKKDLVMAHVNKDTNPSPWPGALSILNGIMSESVMESFDASADVFPQGNRKKYVHSVGVVGGIRFESVGKHPYTGLFQGAEHGIIRLSSATEPSSSGTAPGMGVKFFRDGRPSANFVAMYSPDGQNCSDKDFFAHYWSNHLPQVLPGSLPGKLIQHKFMQASNCPMMVGISDLSSDSTGVGTFPFKLVFKGVSPSDCPCDDYAQCLANLASKPVGTKLFEVHAQAEPGAVRDADQPLIGYITLTDKLTTSKFGDEELFFSHQHMEDDYKIHPDWLTAIDKKAECGRGNVGTKAPTISMGCSPFVSKEYMLGSDYPNVTNVTLV